MTLSGDIRRSKGVGQAGYRWEYGLQAPFDQPEPAEARQHNVTHTQIGTESAERCYRKIQACAAASMLPTFQNTTRNPVNEVMIGLRFRSCRTGCLDLGKVAL
jgi:hypothetical protein